MTQQPPRNGSRSAALENDGEGGSSTVNENQAITGSSTSTSSTMAHHVISKSRGFLSIREMLGHQNLREEPSSGVSTSTVIDSIIVSPSPQSEPLTMPTVMPTTDSKELEAPIHQPTAVRTLSASSMESVVCTEAIVVDLTQPTPASSQVASISQSPVCPKAAGTVQVSTLL